MIGTNDSNGLMDAIRVGDPFYVGPVTPSETKNRIYIHQFPLWIDAIDKHMRIFSAYVGHTDPARGWKVEGTYLIRFGDNDYSKCPEKPVLQHYRDTHKDILDHFIRTELTYRYGWYVNPYGGSPEMMCHDKPKSFEEGIVMLKHHVSMILDKEEKFVEEYIKKCNISPHEEDKRKRDKKQEYYRIPKRLKAVYDLADDLKRIDKDAKIYVPKDAHGRICDTLIDRGFTNIYTDLDYEHFPTENMMSSISIVKRITQEEYGLMKFKVILGNPPYGNQGGEAIDFLAKAGERIEDDGLIILILPSSIRKESSQNKLIRRNPYLECIDDGDLPDDTFPGSIRAVKQTYVLSDSPREKIETVTKHTDFIFVGWARRFEANLFVGRIGGGPCGKVKTENFTHYAKGHYFLKAESQQVIDNMLTLEDKFIIKSKEGSNGRRSLSKHELVTIYSENFGGKESTQSEGRICD